jgi:hypothetical protein
MLKVVAGEAAREDQAAGLDEIVREGARRMLAAALEDEVAAYIAAHAAERDENGRAVGRVQLLTPAGTPRAPPGRPLWPSGRVPAWRGCSERLAAASWDPRGIAEITTSSTSRQADELSS